MGHGTRRQGDKETRRQGDKEEFIRFSMPNDARCFKPGNPSNALAPQCPLPNAQFPLSTNNLQNLHFLTWRN
ncbi:hypothetical protein [Tolypothrix sp. VBCCA 56010]|uniref:hypothetical protein n=1 Tax=Tolypothrix sp. VBCCA 56010 TaxID=3137731 RepID=UPI003D7E9BB0